MKKIAALVLTFNEELNIESCIKSLDFVDQVYVFDSFSTDRTIELAKLAGALVSQRQFDNYAKQRNEALSQIPEDYDWVIMIDADERISEELKQELMSELQRDDNTISMYRVRRKDMFMNKWIRRSSGYPTWFPRIFRNKAVRVEREINEEYHTDGEIKHLTQHLIHYPFIKGIEWWFERHNRYSSMEAIAFRIELSSKISIFSLFSHDPVKRRKIIKQIVMRMPYRPILMFWALYLFRLGFLDGKAGFIYCKLRKTYEWMIDVKIMEIRAKEKNQ